MCQNSEFTGTKKESASQEKTKTKKRSKKLNVENQPLKKLC
jgi:hypothetical protein